MSDLIQYVDSRGLAVVILFAVAGGFWRTSVWFFRPTTDKDAGGYGTRLMEALISFVKTAKDNSERQIAIDESISQAIHELKTSLQNGVMASMNGHTKTHQAIGYLAEMIELVAQRTGADVSKVLEELKWILHASIRGHDSDHG